MSRRGKKKTFAEKLSNKLDKLAKPRDKERTFNKAYQEVYRDYYGNIVPVPRHAGPDLWTHSYAASPPPKRTFHNVIRRGRSAPSHAPGPSHTLANRTWSGWDGGGLRSADISVYGDSVVYDEYTNFAINSNVCMCEDFLEGTHRGKKPKKKCKKCGNDRMMFDHQRQNSVMRRSISEESFTSPATIYTDPFDLTNRKQKMATKIRSQKPVFYDEQDEYDDIDVIPRPLPPPTSHTRSSSSRKIQPIPSVLSRSPMVDRQPARRSSSPVHKKSTRTQSMIVNNRNLFNAKDNKEMQNIAIRASPMRSASSVTGKGKLRAGEGGRNVVTVNGSATKNSSIIYLSPAQDTALPSPLSQDTADPGKYSPSHKYSICSHIGL